MKLPPFLTFEQFESLLDWIIVLRDGQVVEEGNHDMLLRAGGLYYDMWLEQASESWAVEKEEHANKDLRSKES